MIRENTLVEQHILIVGQAEPMRFDQVFYGSLSRVSYPILVHLSTIELSSYLSCIAFNFLEKKNDIGRPIFLYSSHLLSLRA